MKYDVFISYSRKDYIDENKQIIPGNIISKIKDLFDANGIKYWFDEDGVFSGDAFASEIAQNIKSARIFLFISSINSNASEWTSNEIATAHTYKKKIIPFRYDDSCYNDSVIIYIAKLDYIEYRKNDASSLTRLLTSIQSFLKQESEQQKALELRQNEEKKRKQYIDELKQRYNNLSTQKSEVEKEISAHKKAIDNLEDKLQALEQEISCLKEEEKLLFSSTTQNHKETYVNSPQNDVLFTEFTELYGAFKQRSLILNIIEILLLLLFILMGLASLFLAIISSNVLDSVKFAILTAYAYVGFVGTYRLMKNCKDCLYWLIPVFAYSVMLIPFMFIRKKGVSGWNILQKSSKELKNDIVYTFMIFIFIVGIIGTIPLCFLL